MKKLRIERLTLRNFKGIKDFTLQADGADLKVYGDNATGKTSLFDAFLWLLFDKDSKNSSKFAVKTLDVSGKEIHGLEHEVDAVLMVDGVRTELRKVYKEKWTKKKGSISKEFDGHTNQFYVDKAPTSKKEFDAKVESIVDESVFKLLTSPSYFNDQLHWKEKRETLISIAGDVTDDEVLQERMDLNKLMEKLEGRSINKHKEYVENRQKEINKELDRIPVRIDEVNRNKPDLIGLDKEKLQGQKQTLDKKMEEKHEEINRIRSGSEITEQKRQISEIETEINEIKAEYQQHNQSVVADLYQRQHERKKEANSTLSLINQAEEDIKHAKQSIENKERQAAYLRDEWQEEHSRTFQWDEHTHEANTVCPTCAQDLPEDQVEAIHKKAEDRKQEAIERFNQRKAERLEQIKQSGMGSRKAIDSLKQQIEQTQKVIAATHPSYDSAIKSLEGIDEQIKAAEAKQINISASHDYQEKVAEKKRIEQKIAELQTSSHASIDEVNKSINAIREQLNSVTSDLSKFDQAVSADARIQQLSDDQRRLADQYEALEEEIHMADEFTRTKVNMLEDRINSKFEHASFKLREDLLNGGFTEICQTLYKGVPYEHGLNNAARINVGLDIIRTLSRHYGLSAPIFIDNSEAVTQLMDVDAQLIALVVSEPDKQLRVEPVGEQHKEAI